MNATTIRVVCGQCLDFVESQLISETEISEYVMGMIRDNQSFGYYDGMLVVYKDIPNHDCPITEYHVGGEPSLKDKIAAKKEATGDIFRGNRPGMFWHNVSEAVSLWLRW